MSTTFLSLVAAGALTLAPPAQASSNLLPQSTEPPAGGGSAQPRESEGEREVLTLEAAIAQAEKSSLDLEVLRARAAQAETISAKVWSAYLPQLSVAGGYTYNNTAAELMMPTAEAIRDMGVPIDPEGEDLPGAPTPYVSVPYGFESLEIQKQHAFAAQAQLSQAIFAPTLWTAGRVAGLSERISELNIENARREVLFAVTQSFYAVATMQESVKVTEALLKVAADHERDAQLQVETGTAPRLTLLRAQLDRSRAEQDLVRAQTNLVSARLALATLLNRRADFEVAPPPEPEVPADLERGEVLRLANEAIERRPDIAALSVQRDVAQIQHGQSWFKYLPTIGLSANYSIQNAAGFTGRPDNWNVGLGLNWNIFDGGLREAENRELAAKLREARALEEQAQRNARDEVFRARLDLESARANRLKAEDTARLARESAAMVELQFRAGASSYIEVADSNSVLTQAEVGLLTERLNEQLAALQLIKAAGLFAVDGSL